MRWRLLLEEYGPEIVYIKGKTNIVVDALSRLSRQGDIVEDVEAVLPFVPVDATIFPVNLSEAQELQEQDRSLRKQLRNNPKEFSKKELDQMKIITHKNIFIRL